MPDAVPRLDQPDKAGHPKLAPVKDRGGESTLLEADDIKVHFPIRMSGGLFGKTKPLKAVNGVSFAVPGRLDSVSGGYGYDRQIIAGLQDLGWAVDVVELGDGFPWPEATALQRAEQRIAAIADGRTVVIDGLAYGMEAYGLGQRLSIPTREAQEILDAYFHAFPSVKAYMDRTVEEARERGYTETLFGRRRRIPELASGQRNVRMAGERQAMNAGIQGLAADIFKVALVRIDTAFQAADHQAELILQVHDEVICEVVPEHLDEVRTQVVDIMTGAFEMNVPLEVNVSSGDTWAAAKG